MKAIDFSCKHDVLLQDDKGNRLPMDEPYFESEQIAPETWKIRTDGDFCYLVEGDEEALMIDTGYGAGNIREYAQSLTEKPLRNVVNTHDHFDHTANNCYFDCAFMSAATKPLATIPFPSFEGIVFPRDYPVQVISEGDVIRLGGRELEVFEIPDHAVGSIALLDSRERLLFTGDEIMPMGKPLNGSVERFCGYLKKLWARRDEYDRLCAGLGVIEADWIGKYMENMEYILAGNVGKKPQGGPALRQMYGENGELVYLRSMPHYPDIVGKHDVKPYQLTMEYAGCKVTYDSRNVYEKGAK
ncbi:MAG: MBL fold metallo-hydrolase [Eubacteriales bacterium]|nr:MBL fold metallo-hydrolase [Eubacteriales bacterium]